jgi:cellulose synthase (UDP-forming)
MDSRQTTHNNKTDFLKTHTPRVLVILNCILAIIYLIILTFVFPIGNMLLFVLLLLGEIFHLWQLFTFLYTVWDTQDPKPLAPTFTRSVDVFITVAGEPKEIVEETLVAALAMDYPSFKVFILNDGLVAKRDNWREAVELGKQYGVEVITREIPGGAKAGNINNALKASTGEFVVIFDADHVPYPHFLSRVMPYFNDDAVAFVQSPQYYKNNRLNLVTHGAWEQQELFFGPICRGKNRLNAATMCGTNMAIRRSMLLEVGGMCEESIAEDFATGLFLHEHGWKSVYVPEILAEGLAPEDFLSYYKQQFRWARGALDVIFKYKLLFRKGLTLPQKIQYLSSASFYLSGPVVLLNASIPLVFFFTGYVPVVIATMLLALVFLPYIFITLYTLQGSSNFTYTFRSLAVSMGAFVIHIEALWSTLSGKKPKFDITSKKKLEGNFLYLVRPHMVYIGLVIIGMVYSLYREGVSASFVANSSWAVLYIFIFYAFIQAAMPERRKLSRETADVITGKSSVSL